MKHFLFLILYIFFAATSYTQPPNFNWVQRLERATGLPFDESYFIGTDAERNVYVAGNFHFTIDLDPGAGVSNVTSAFDNVFVSKFNSAGSFVWGKHVGKNDKYTVCKSLSVDAAGNVYTTGYFNGKADFDPGPDVYNLTSTRDLNYESNDIFISKLDANGNFRWAKQVGASGIDIGTCVNADIFGNVYITGYFSGAVDFDPGPASVTKGSGNVVNCFISKYDAAGNFRYAKVFEGNHHSEGKFIRTDANGNVYTSGYFDGDVDFDPGDGVQRFTTDLFAQKNFLSKLDSAGNYLWAIRDINGLDIAADDIGNVYTYDSELTKYDPGGNLVWRKPMGGIPNSTFAHAAIKTDGAGNIYITGSFHYTQDFDPGALEYKLSTTGGGYAGDVFVCKLDTDGRFMWATSFGGPGEDYATSLAVDDAQNVYTTGVFFGNADFDVGPETYNLAAASGGSVFVHKMSPCKNIAPVALTVNSCKSYTLNNVTYEKSGTYTQILPAASGCDSIIQLTLEMTRITTNLNATTCNSYEFNGRSLTSSGFYTDTFQTASGCDSIVRLNLTITRSSTQVSASVCMGQTYGGHTTSGTYTDTFKTANGCDSVVTINLTVLPKPAPALGPDIELCAGDSITVSPGIFQSYLWQDGSVLPSLTIKNAGVYAVTVTNACGEGRNELRVTVSQCKLNFPSAFTPNGDGRNDRFALLRPPVLNSFRLLVYNRFGQLVFQTTDYLKGWTGLYKGLPAPSGTYVWTCRIEESGRVSNLKGTVVLLR